MLWTDWSRYKMDFPNNRIDRKKFFLRYFPSFCFFSRYQYWNYSCRKIFSLLLCNRFSERPHVSGSILTRPKIVVLTSSVKKVTKKKKKRRGHSRITIFFSLFAHIYNYIWYSDRSQEWHHSKAPSIYWLFIFSLFTKYQILNSELILYRYGKVIIFFFLDITITLHRKLQLIYNYININNNIIILLLLCYN